MLAISDEYFAIKPPAGGHACAWHALHIADWTRILVPSKLQSIPKTERFAYLGWEDHEFAKRVYGESSIKENDPKEQVIEYLNNELERSLGDLQAADPAIFENKIHVPTGEKVILDLISFQIGHLHYHYGQVKLIKLQLSRMFL